MCLQTHVHSEDWPFAGRPWTAFSIKDGRETSVTPTSWRSILNNLIFIDSMRHFFKSLLIVAVTTSSLVMASSVPQLEITMEYWKDADGKSCSSTSTGCQPLKVKYKLPEDFALAKSQDTAAPPAQAPSAAPPKSADPPAAVPPAAKSSTTTGTAAPAASSSTNTTSAASTSSNNATNSTSAASASAPAASTNSTVATAAKVSADAAPSASAPATNSTAAPAASSANSTTSTDSKTNSTAAAGGDAGGIAPSAETFKKAVVATGFSAPTDAQYTNFVGGISKSGITSKRELAAFLAQILHESDGLQAREEYACKNNACPGQYDSGPGGQYYGRGYIQLTWKANYEAASKALYGDDRLVQKPQSVAEDDAVAWAVSFNFWKTIVHPAPGVQDGKFGATTKAINGALECGAPNEKAKKRFSYYSKILTAWGITEAPIESGCYN